MGLYKYAKKLMPLIGIAIFVYFIIKLDIKNIYEIIITSNLKFIIIASFFTILIFISQTFKWWIIALKQKMNVPFWEAFKIDLISYFYGFVTPSKLGSVSRAEYLKKYSGNFGKGLSNFVIDKILDLISLFCLTILFLNIFDFIKVNLITVISLFLGFILVFFIFYNKNRSKTILRIFYKRFVPEKMKDKSKELFENFYEDLPKKRYLLLAFIFNLLNWVTTYVTIYFIGRAVGINIGLIYFLGILPITTLVAQLPITVGGIGTREAAMIFLFKSVGAEGAKVFSMSLLNILISGLIPCLIAIIFLITMPKNDIH